MKEFKDFINELNTDKPIDCIITFFIDNEWFGETLRKKNGKIILSDEQIEFFTDKLTPFLGNKDVSIYEYFKEKFPETYKLYNIFQSETQVAEETTHYIVDFMLYRLNKELFFYSDNEMEELLSNATFELIKAHGDIFTFFIAWLKLNHKTAYQKDYVLNKRYTMDIQNEAYDFDDYICLLYYLFSEDYIENNEMFRKAAESKNYTDTWLYLALHFIRPLRMTDMERIYHPILPYSSEEVIEKIKNDEFSDNDARYVLLSITKRMKDCDHTWEATFALRHMGSGKCPECYKVGRNIKEECFAAIYPEYVELWSSDNERTPYDTFYTSNLWIKWKCAKCNGIYGANINDMVNGVTKCPYCRGTKILAGFNSFAHNHPELLDELDEIDNYLLPVTPDEVSDESSQKFWWTCKKNTKHKYPMSPKTRLMFQKRNREPCLYCRGQRRKLNHFVEYNPKKQQ